MDGDYGRMERKEAFSMFRILQMILLNEPYRLAESRVNFYFVQSYQTTTQHETMGHKFQEQRVKLHIQQPYFANFDSLDISLDLLQVNMVKDQREYSDLRLSCTLMDKISESIRRRVNRYNVPSNNRAFIEKNKGMKYYYRGQMIQTG
jgi:hypothetical protein